MDQAKEFFQWKEAFEVGIPQLDEEHRAFLDLLNRCYDSGFEQNKGIVGMDVIAQLKKHVTLHFQHEEGVLEHVGYTDLEHQRRQHLFFAAQIEDLENLVRKEDTAGINSTVSLLRDWFVHHILEEDMKYVSQVTSGEGHLGRGEPEGLLSSLSVRPGKVA